MSSDTFFEPWWYVNGGNERDHDLATAEKETGSTHDTLSEARNEVKEVDPEHEAFINEYRIDSGGYWELVDEYDDPRIHS